ncbi:SDR family NAD(P)-dependent oxidoreductase [uncultured Clostridium sp.]|uniref:SDR family NAD(P)-dependent oxidoreductase n=1 Tax=uncultured Clostridium sp. TaxID=59620 RepID=UPI0025F07804|nr:glucose 1-dehydrogenase [uncultured Clostridium sp.]
MGRLDGKVAIVTGAGVGIGNAIVKMYAKEGAKVALTCRNESAGKKVQDEINSLGGTAKYFKQDVSQEAQCKFVVDETVKLWGKLDILVNNAGISGEDKDTHEYTSDEWDAVFNIDVKGVFYMTKYAVPYMKENQGGSIINMSSIWGIVGSTELAAYHAAKGAVTLMTKRDAVGYGKDHIRVNSIHPGTIITPLVQKLVEQQEGYLEREIELAPLGYLGEPDDIAYAAVFLGSDESKFMTGAKMVIDGGYTAR